MRARNRLALLLASAAVAILLCSRAGLAADNPAFRIANLLSGTFQGSTPGNELTIDFQPVPSDLQHPYDLFVDVRGRYLENSIKRQGVLRPEIQGKAITLTYVPKFDATATAMSTNATVFTQSEAGAACSLDLAPSGDGFAGQTLASSCAFALRGGMGKWSVEIEPGGLRLRNVDSGETLRFRKKGQ